MNEYGDSGRRVTQERQLALLEFIRSHTGVTTRQIREAVQGYAGQSETTTDRYIVRDIKELRWAGYPIVTDSHTYVYDRAAPLVASVSQLDLGLLKATLGAMDNKDQRMFTARNGLQKLLATSDASVANARYLQAAIPEGNCVAVVARAIQDSRVVTFAYPDGRTGEVATYALEPVELSEHFDAFYVAGKASKNSGPWIERTFRLSRIDASTLEVGDSFSHEPDPEALARNNSFTVRDVLIAIRPSTSRPLAVLGTPCVPPASAPDGWECYAIDEIDKNRLAEYLVTYGLDVKLIGPASYVAQWRKCLSHLAGLGGAQ